jgi:hypothetical protein
MNRLVALAVALVSGIVLSNAAGAVTVSQSLSLPAPGGPNPLATTATAGVFQNVTASVTGLYRSPWKNTANDGAEFTAVRRKNTASYDYGRDQFRLALMWGSVNTYNYIDFWNDGAKVFTLTGADLFPTAPQNTGFSVVTVKNILFDRAVFGSTGNTFEYASLNTAQVPIPPGLPMFLLALGALALVSRARA